MPASTSGKPVRPSFQSAKSSASSLPAIAARAVVFARDGGECGRHLMVEVAPAELADEGLTAWPTGGPPRHLDGREAAEVQVGAEA